MKKRNTKLVQYTGRRSLRVPTEKHQHVWSVVKRVKGNSIRMGCRYCPALDRWDGAHRYGTQVQEAVKAIKELRRKDNYLSTVQRAARALGGRVVATLTTDDGTAVYDSTRDAVDILTGKSGWTTDTDGFTPDEKPKSPWNTSLGRAVLQDEGYTDAEIDRDISHWESRGDDIIPDVNAVEEQPHPKPYEDDSDRYDNEFLEVHGFTPDWREVDEPIQDMHTSDLENMADADADRRRRRSALEQFTKTELLERFPVYLKKSWTKDKMIDVIIGKQED